MLIPFFSILLFLLQVVSIICNLRGRADELLILTFLDPQSLFITYHCKTPSQILYYVYVVAPEVLLKAFYQRPHTTTPPTPAEATSDHLDHLCS
jgi:hypothetical protein